MNKIKMTLAVIVAIIVVAGIAWKIAIPSLSGTSVATGIANINGQSTLGDCPDTPNCYGSEASRAEQSVTRMALTKPASDAINTLATIVSSQPGTQIVTQDERYLHATFSTRVMGYTDDVEFLISDDQQSVQMRSASRIGKSDLGANAQRLTLLRSLAERQI